MGPSTANPPTQGQKSRVYQRLTLFWEDLA